MFRLFLKCIYSYLKLLLCRKKGDACLVVPQFEHFGGTKTYFISLIKFLSREKFDVTVILSAKQLDEEIRQLQVSYPFKIEITEFDVWRTSFKFPYFSALNKSYLRYQLQELLYFWQILKTTKASLLLCSVGNPEELLFLFLSPVKIIYVLHTSTMDYLDELKRWMLNFRLSRNRQIVTVSNSAKKYVLKNWTGGKNASRINVVYNYYEPLVTPIPDTNDTIPNILTLGTVAFYKNPIFWVEVCKQVSARYSAPITFIWAGDGPLLEKCRAIVADVPSIQFVGFEKNVDILFAQCSIYFQPSIHESHGISVIGAMYYKKPCVVSDKGGLPESVVNSETGWVVSIDNLEEAVTFLVSLLKNSALGRQMGQNGRRRFDQLFTRESWEKKMVSIIRI
jgi:glycosyltransferase involved in cell wall biosynthesis